MRLISLVLALATGCAIDSELDNDIDGLEDAEVSTTEQDLIQNHLANLGVVGMFKNFGKCVDIYRKSTADNAQVLLDTCNGGDNQLFGIFMTGTPSTMPTKMNVSRVLRAAGPNVNDGVTSRVPDGTTRQNWSMRDFAIRGANNCLQAPGSSSSAMIMSTCDGGADQKWNYVAASGRIVLSDGRCLTALNPNAQGSLVATTCNQFDARQSWFPSHEGWLQLRNGSNLCLDIPYGSSTPGTIVQTYPCHTTGAPQHFKFRGSVVEESTGLCLGLPVVAGAPDSRAHTPIVLAACAENQKWELDWSYH